MKQINTTGRKMDKLEEEFFKLYFEAVKDIGYTVFKEAVLSNMKQLEQEYKVAA